MLTRCSEAGWVGVSIISELELFAFQDLKNTERQAIVQFLDRVEVAGLYHTDRAIIQYIADLRISTGLKLPDSIIAAQAFLRNGN